MDNSAPDWVLPVEAKNIIRYLTDVNVPSDSVEISQNNLSMLSSGSEENELDYSTSYDFGGKDMRSESDVEEDDGSRDVMQDDFSCSNNSDTINDHSMLLKQSVGLPKPTEQVQPDTQTGGNQDQQQSRAILEKVKRLNQTDPEFDIGVHNSSPSPSYISNQQSSELHAIQPNLNPTGNRFEILDYRNEIIRLRGLLSDKKEVFRNLQISSGVYEELKRTPEFELSLVDFVRLQAAELLHPLQEELQSLRLLNEQQQRQLDTFSHTIASQASGIEVQKRLLESSVEAYKLEAQAASERCDRLSEKLQMAESARQVDIIIIIVSNPR